jgi:hypothetical protein
MLKLIPSASEHQTHLAVVEHLQWRAVSDLFAFHVPNGGWRTKAEAGLLKAMGVVAGVPDLMLLHQAHLFGLELKREGGRLSPDQIAVHDAMRRAGATVSTVYGVDEALDQLAEWKLLR